MLITQKCEKFGSFSEEKFRENILDFNKWIMDNYNKYHMNKTIDGLSGIEEKLAVKTIEADYDLPRVNDDSGEMYFRNVEEPYEKEIAYRDYETYQANQD